MNQLDALLLVLLVPFALRGWWRGFCRESFGLAGLFGGVLAAAAAGPQLATGIAARRLVPHGLALPLAWGVVFVGTWFLAAVLGRLAERLARALLLGGLNGAAGALFGSAKGAALLGFGLLLAEHLAPSSALAKVIATSRLGRPLEQIAGSVVTTGRQLGGEMQERRA